jgi:hypothetical protein
MGKHPDHDRPSLDSRAFTLLLSAMFSNTLLWAGASVISEMQPQAGLVAVAATPSHLPCARL